MTFPFPLIDDGFLFPHRRSEEIDITIFSTSKATISTFLTTTTTTTFKHVAATTTNSFSVGPFQFRLGFIDENGWRLLQT